jgi:hypothetical protein
MESELELAVKTIYDALTTVWEDNGNILADAVRDSVVMNLGKITGESMEKIEEKVNILIEDAQ